MFVGGSFPMPMAGGSVNYVYRLLTGIDDFSYFIYTGNDDIIANQEFDKNYSHTIIRSKFCYHVLERFEGGILKRQLYHIIAIIQIVYYILKYKPKIVCLTEITLISISLNIAKLFHHFGIGLFTYAEEIQMDMNRPVHRQVFASALKNADFIFTVCDYTRSILNSIEPVDDKIVKIIPSVPIPREHNDHPKSGSGKVMILTVARLEERKGHVDVLNALAKIKKDRDNFEYRIVGGGSYKETIEKKIHELGLDSHVKMLGKITDSELEEEYYKADIFVLHHKQLSNGDTEGCPTVFLEAGCHHLPVIGGEAGGVSDAIINKETGFICHVGSDDLYNYLKILIADPSLRRVMGNKGYNYANKFNVENQAAKFRKVLLDQLKKFNNS